MEQEIAIRHFYTSIYNFKGVLERIRANGVKNCETITYRNSFK